MKIRARHYWSMAALALIGAALVAGVAPAARAADADLLREVRDRADIEALMWRYVRALDTFDEDAYASVYTPDGRFTAGTMTAAGPEALRKMIAGFKQRRAEQAARGEKPPPMHHIITNTYLEFIDRDHARLNSYWMTVFEGADPSAPPRVAAAGRGIDELVRLDGKWLIRTRDVTPKD